MKYISQFVYKTIWNIGFVEDSLDEILQGRNKLCVHWMKHDFSDRWFADPFLLDVTDDYYLVLAEVYYRKERKARIEKLTIDRATYQLEKSQTILQLETHLSFPLIREENGKIYIFPENGKALTFNKYYYDQNQGLCKFEKQILNCAVADAVPCSLSGRSFISATLPPSFNGDTLSFFVQDCSGEYVHHSDYSFQGRRIARNAGDWFVHGGKMFRPAQDCEEEYGGSMLIQEVHLDKTGLPASFTDIVRIEPQSSKYYSGCHTFNMLKGQIVIDGWGYKYKILKKIVLFCAQLKYRLFNL